jgi:alkylation response protein AidB-like acyl-CoA dehydrogenase
MVQTISRSVNGRGTALGETLSDRVRPHLDAIASLAAQTEAARSVPPENVEIIRNAGFVRAFVPAERGGDERDLWDFCDGVRTVTKACPSTGWVAGVLNVHQAAIGLWEPSVQDEVFATGPDTIICSSGSPAMKAKLVDGGFVVSGRGRWSSGCEHAEWAMVGAHVPDVSDKQFPERNYRPYLFMVHRSQYEIDDTWHATCMSGSGSHDLVFDNLFVPNRRAEEVMAMNFGRSRGAGSVDNWISRIPFALIFGTFFAAVALGCADGMVEEYTKRQRSRKSVMTGAQGILNAASHMRLAESVHELESLTTYYKQLCDSMQEFGMTGEKLTEAKFNAMQHSFPFVTERAMAIVERLFQAAGASAILTSNPMQRYWRDVHACRLHFGQDYDVSRLQHGRHLIGLAPTPDL